MSLNETNVKVTNLQLLYANDPVARLMLDYFASRKRNSMETTVERIQETLDVDGRKFHDSDIRNVFRQLETAGCGKLIIGRHGRPTRFNWEVRLIDVGKAASDSREVDSFPSTPLPEVSSSLNEITAKSPGGGRSAMITCESPTKTMHNDSHLMTEDNEATAHETDEVVQDTENGEEEEQDELVQYEGDDGVSEVLEHVFYLRPDFAVCLELPTDLTKHEAARLARFLKTLPFSLNS